MKSIFKKMIAATACVSMMAAGTALNVSAAEGVYFNLADEVTVKAGEEATVELYTVESDAQFDTMSLMLNYDSDLEFVSAKSKLNIGEAFNAKNNKPTSQVYLQMALSDEPKVINNDKLVLIEVTFKTPDDAKAGTKYSIKWADEAGYGFSIKDSTTSGTTNLTHTYDEEGSIVIETPPVTTEPTTTEPTTTTTTTTAVTTTTTAPATTTTTTAATKATGTAAATKSTTKVTSAPVTGNDSKGIAALAATMVAAAGAAIVIKKKKD